MAQQSNSFEGGTNAVAITTGNSGGTSGDALQAIGSTPAYSNLHPHNGGMGGLCDTGGGAVSTWMAQGLFTFNSTWYSRFYGYCAAAPVTTNNYIWVAQDTTGTPVRQIGLRHIASTGQYAFFDANGTQYTGAAGSIAIPLNQLFRLDLRILPTTSRRYNRGVSVHRSEPREPCGGYCR